MSTLQALFDAMEAAKDDAPLFPVEAPDGKKMIAETPRQTQFVKMMRECAPSCAVEANANAGKRNPVQAKREGIVSGVFDMTIAWAGGVAWVEFKGYTKAGRAGGLSDNQIAWGNRRHRLGHHVACFFDPMSAVLWLRSIGAPVLLRGGL